MVEAGRAGKSGPDPSPSLRELAAIFFRHSRIVVAVFALVVLSTLLYAVASQRYEARLKILLRRGRSDPMVSPEPENPGFTRAAISEEELNSEVELLRDEGLLRQVAVQSGLVAPGDVTAGRGERVERAVRELERALTVEPLRKSNLIQVRYESGGAELSANVLSTLSLFYLRKHMELQRPSGELQFFETQTSAYQEKLRESENELVHFTQDRGVAAPSLERDIALQKLGEAEAAYRQIEQDRVDNERRTASLSAQLKSFPSRSVTLKRWADNPQLLEKLKSHLLELQLKRTKLLTRYEPAYRLVQEVDQQIEQTRESITAEGQTPVRDETTDKDPNYEWARLELEKTQVQEESLKARQARATAQIAGLHGLAEQMQSDAVAQQHLIRDAKANEENFLLYQRKREEARIGDALDERRILNVAVVEPPVAPALPMHSMLFWLAVSVGLAGSRAKTWTNCCRTRLYSYCRPIWKVYRLRCWTRWRQGVCAFTSDIPENREVLAGCGFTFKSGDRLDLKRVLERLIRNPALRQQRAARGEQRIREKYLWLDVARSIEAAYYKVLERGRPTEELVGNAKEGSTAA